MRVFGKLFVLASVALAVAGLAVGHAQFQPGGFGKAKNADYFTLIQNPQVKGELKLTDQQVEMLTPAAWKALSEVLDAKQLKRFREIYLQQRGNSVYLDA